MCPTTPSSFHLSLPIIVLMMVIGGCMVYRIRFNPKWHYDRKPYLAHVNNRRDAWRKYWQIASDFADMLLVVLVLVIVVAWYISK